MKAATLWLILAFNAVVISAVPEIQLLNFDEITPITTVTLHEDTTTQTSLAIVRCVNEEVTLAPSATPTKPVIEDCVCNLVRTVPTNGPFDVWKLNNNNNNNQININVNDEKDFKAFFVGTAQATSTLDYDTQRTHYIIARCTSPTVTIPSSSVTIEVDILPNQQPVISSYPAASSQPLTANQANTIGTTVYTVTATDPEGDALAYTMTQNPDNKWLTIEEYDGRIRTAVDTRVITSETIVCTLTVSDGKNTINNFIVAIRFTNLNTRPYIANLPASITVTDDQPSEFVLKTLAYGDDTPQTNQPDPESEHCVMNRVTKCHTIIYDSAIRQLRLITKGQLDTGSKDKYLITCVISDGFFSSEEGVLTMYAYRCTDQSTEESLLDDDGFVAFFATSIVLISLILLVIVWHVFGRRGKAAKHPPPTQVTPQ